MRDITKNILVSFFLGHSAVWQTQIYKLWTCKSVVCIGVNSGTVPSSVHIYADPDAYDLVGDGLTMPDEQSYNRLHQLPQLNPAHITIDVVVHRGIALLIKLSYHFLWRQNTTSSRFLPRCGYAAAVLWWATVRPSVHLYVRLSVKCVNCDKTKAPSEKKFNYD